MFHNFIENRIKETYLLHKILFTATNEITQILNSRIKQLAQILITLFEETPVKSQKNYPKLNLDSSPIITKKKKKTKEIKAQLTPCIDCVMQCNLETGVIKEC